MRNPKRKKSTLENFFLNSLYHPQVVQSSLSHRKTGIRESRERRKFGILFYFFKKCKSVFSPSYHKQEENTGVHEEANFKRTSGD